MSLLQDLERVGAQHGYRLIRQLGCGGMGCVYLVRHEKSGEERALKLIVPQSATNAKARDLFLREIANARAVSNPNVVLMLDAGVVENVLFLVMEFCEGGSIDALVAQDGPLPLQRAVDIVMDVLSGLEYAHMASLPDVVLADGTHQSAVGLVHRDLKPQNIFLKTEAGRATAKVGDLGLAKAFELSGLSGITMTGTCAGTPAFMPRQQVVNFKYVGPEVDIWAATATLYFLLTGFTPRDFHQGRDPWLTVRETNPVPISSRGVLLPSALAQVIDEALADNPKIRYRTAAELRAALESAQ